MPPLRERHGDVQILAKFFLKKYNKKNNTKRNLTISREALKAMEKYHWPGNVRELENCIERAVLLTPGDVIGIEDLFIPSSDTENGRRKNLKEMEKDIVLKVLKEEAGNKTRTAEVLGVSLRWLHYKLNEWNVGSKNKKNGNGDQQDNKN
jgi:DNA-binding NtrC family response regulator